MSLSIFIVQFVERLTFGINYWLPTVGQVTLAHLLYPSLSTLEQFLASVLSTVGPLDHTVRILQPIEWMFASLVHKMRLWHSPYFHFSLFLSSIFQILSIFYFMLSNLTVFAFYSITMTYYSLISTWLIDLSKILKINEPYLYNGHCVLFTIKWNYTLRLYFLSFIAFLFSWSF